ncbi:MAG: PQQ-dependent sugar dehydrogenase [Bacteroidia bacterium]|nr:PQQ-dependent sugar dehydrogenase [Bacteroidia bacterium]
MRTSTPGLQKPTSPLFRLKKTLLTLLLGTILIAAAVPLGILQSGIDNPTPVGAFLDGKLPVTTPSTVSAWTTEVAFPNLEFMDPLDLREVPGHHKFMMAGKKGFIWTFDKDTTTAVKDTMLVIEDSVYTAGDAGLLGAIFHPKFNATGNPAQDSNYLYVYYRFAYEQNVQRPKAYCRLSRFTVDPVTLKSHDSTEFVMIQQYDRHDWHNGGGMFFDENGFLYLTNGDEGGANDVYNTSQKMNVGLLGGVLRIDVDNDPSKSDPVVRQPLNPDTPPAGWPGSFSQGYSIPKDNPWNDRTGDTLGEFWSIGLRSPHRMTYDSVTATIWIGDIGQGSREEITLAKKGANNQWPYKEGNLSGQRSKPTNLIGYDLPPVLDYPRSDGTCVIGGFVYRGDKWPDLKGKYIFGDHTTRKIWAIDATDTLGTADKVFLATVPAFGSGGKSGISSFATDSTGEIYVLKLYGTNLNGGRIYKLSAANSAPEPPALLSQLGIFDDLNSLTPMDFMIPYDLIEPFWSDDALKSRWMVIPNDGTHNSAAEQIVFDENGDWEFPEGAVMVKHFDMQIDETNPSLTRKLETRLMVRGTDDLFYGVTYRWRDDQSDAELQTVGRYDTLQIATASSGPREIHWYYPDRQECLFCHNNGSKSVLGPKTRQLNEAMTYHQTGRSANQLKTLTHLQVFDTPPDTNNLGALLTAKSKDDTGASLEDRARTYLDTNCGYCHRPGTSISAFFDARYDTPLEDQNILYGPLFNKFGLVDPRAIVPGDLEHSLIYQRMNAIHDNLAMPPLAKNLKDTAGIELMRDYILSLSPDVSVSDNLIVADYGDDFGAPSGNGWEYLWNGGGPIGNDANYQSLSWNGTLYDGDGANNGFPDPVTFWANLSNVGGHPGRALNQGQATSRFVIAGYTVSTGGDYRITNSELIDANVNCGDGAELRVYVNNTLIQTIAYNNGQNTTFDMDLGTLTSGDKVYVCLGPKDTGDGCDGFQWDYSIVRSSVKYGQRITFPTIARQTSQVSGITVPLGASASSGLNVNYTLIKGPGNISGNSLIVPGNASGEVIIRAEQTGNSNYFAAPSVERSFWITPVSTAEGTGLLATYFNDKDFQFVKGYRVDPQIDFRWGSGAPLQGMDLNTFAVAWEGEIESPVSELITFYATTDDGVRLYVNNQLVIDNWKDQGAETVSGTYSMLAWQRLPIRIEYYENRVYARSILEWSSASIDRNVIPSMFLYPAANSSFPIELSGFFAEADGPHVRLDWTTELEENASHFDIERAADGQNFGKIGQMEVNGRSRQGNEYDWLDKRPFLGPNYYRLKMIDTDGSFTYSEIRMVEMTNTFISIYPNPVSRAKAAWLELSMEEALPVNVRIFDLGGRMVSEETINSNSKQFKTRLNTSQLEAGTYMIFVKVPGNRPYIKKLTVM